jgi:hypothetical protein
MNRLAPGEGRDECRHGDDADSKRKPATPRKSLHSNLPLMHTG